MNLLNIYIKKINQYNKQKPTNEKIHVRIGINSGMISKHKGVKGRGNYWGRGLIHAQRIMNAGDESHILIRANVAQELTDISDEYKHDIHYIGNIAIKHGDVIPFYSAYGVGFGNKNSPQSFKQQSTTDVAEYGRFILEELVKSDFNPKNILALLKQNKQTKLSVDSKKKRRKN